jgi:Ca2+-binding EF-hand superfamily protein
MDNEELRENFDYFDADGDGKLDLSEFSSLMKALDALDPGESAALGFKAIDTDGSGQVEFDEFERWFSQR